MRDRIAAFRAGSFASNADTYRALRTCGIGIDSSLNEVCADSAPDLRGKLDFTRPQAFEGVNILPMTVFRDGTGRLRPAQLGACSFAELRQDILAAQARGLDEAINAANAAKKYTIVLAAKNARIASR